jgi:Concanavalin A-like lectin/glucanases superfamily
VIPGCLSQALLRSSSGGGGPTDPNYSSVVLLWEAEGTNGQTAGITEAKNGRAITLSGTAKIDSTQKLYGNTSFYPGSGDAELANNIDWRLSAANSDAFTLEIAGLQTTLATQWDIIEFWGSPGNYSFLCRWQSSGEMTFYWSSDGSTLQSLTTSGAGATSTSSWYKWCIEKNSAGKIRIYLNGVMKGSVTPANSAFFSSSGNLIFNTPSSNACWVDHVRITKGVARFNSDAGYTPDTGPYPTS